MVGLTGLTGLTRLTWLLLAPAATTGCPALNSDGTIPGTCTPGTPGCKQGSQCQQREANPFMPMYAHATACYLS
jgi:hypothetical protein